MERWAKFMILMVGAWALASCGLSPPADVEAHKRRWESAIARDLPAGTARSAVIAYLSSQGVTWREYASFYWENRFRCDHPTLEFIDRTGPSPTVVKWYVRGYLCMDGQGRLSHSHVVTFSDGF